MRRAFEIAIEGTVQGVGFRPFLARLANSMKLAGYVENRENGVKVVVFCTGDELELFLESLESGKPGPSRITALNVKRSKISVDGQKSFLIAESKKTGSNTVLIPPDIAVCNQCVAEMFSSHDRRHLYPFISCSECGPRFSITAALPYDRDKTTMNEFSQCEICASEFTDPVNRRYHAQTNCCQNCGPSYELVQSTGKKVGGDPVARAIRAIGNDKIVALKGIGGFSLVCKPVPKACNRLRLLKDRPQKPFALMARDVETIGAFADISAFEEEELLSAARPIVLLKLKNNRLRELVAPGLNRVGVMLPYMGIHNILLEEFPLLVVTSGNVSGEMLCATDREAYRKLCDYCDYFLVHNREITNRCDDSLVKISGNRKLFLRKSRGYIPERISIPSRSGQVVLATGADMKSSFGFSRDGVFVGSQYLADLEYRMNQDAFRKMIASYEELFDTRATVVVSDAHPGYFSSHLGREYAQRNEIPQYLLQHHLAHIYSVMAEHQLTDCIGVAFDGTGYGDDAQVWGGEFFHVSGHSSRRFAHLRYVPMPGGEMSARYPYLMQGAYQLDSGITIDKKTELMCKHAPVLTSSAGRLFDAASSILGVCRENTYEGEAAMKLEAISKQSCETLPWELEKLEPSWEIDFRKTILQLFSRRKKEEISLLASAFHNTLADVVLQTCLEFEEGTNTKVVCLSGGVFQNTLLLDRCTEMLSERGFCVFFNERVSPNDEGIALGQAYWFEMRT